MAGREEARGENLEPFSYRCEIISTTFGFRKSNRPFTQLVIAPRLPGKEGDFCRAHALSNDIVQKEVVQLIRTDHVLGALDGAVSVGRDQLWRNFGSEYRIERRPGVEIELLCLDCPANEMLDQSLRNAGVERSEGASCRERGVEYV